ncbi:multinuclear nonheme iron-dependent oxidase [Roseateles noduli]|uniref:multinuclear nonheme iron-dependent oxidase n=1 Tax=Roseateles noduli TaxID=2052484 RepID=UPI003D651F64
MKRGSTLWPVAVGIGWRQPHYREVMAHSALDLDFLEVHTENFLAPGGAGRQLLLDAARRCPVSLHGVGLGLGSAVGVDYRHLQRVRALIEAVKPAVVSEHAGFTRVRHRHGIVHAHQPLPVPLSPRGLARLVSQVDAVQQGLGRQILIENLGAHVGWDEDVISEPDFLNALAERTGCGLLLDLNSVFVHALNRGLDDEAALRAGLGWLDGVEPAAVGQYHVSGHSRVDGLVFADHGSAVGEAVWSLYSHALTHIGARPTLIEWDNALPPLTALCGEVARARREQAALDRELIAPPPPRPSSRHERVRPTSPPTSRPTSRIAAERDTAPMPSTAVSQPPARDRRCLPDAELPNLPDVSNQPHLPDLADQQAGLVTALLAGPGTDIADLAPAGLRALAGITGGLPRALRAYQAHLSAQAERALAAVYPRLRERVEADEPGSFASLAWACWRRHPPADGDLGEWGEVLVGLLAGAEAEGLPPLWTAQARIEWELHRVARIADPQADLDSLALLGRLPAGAVRLVLADHVALHGCDAPGPRALLELASESFGSGPRHALMVWRDGWGAQSIALDGVTTRWFESLRAGLDLERALHEVGAAFDFSAWLSTAVTRGWLARVETVEMAVTPWGGR